MPRNIAKLIPKLNTKERDWVVDLLSGRTLQDHPHLIINYMFSDVEDLCACLLDTIPSNTAPEWHHSLKTLKRKVKAYVEELRSPDRAMVETLQPDDNLTVV